MNRSERHRSERRRGKRVAKPSLPPHLLELLRHSDGPMVEATAELTEELETCGAAEPMSVRLTRHGPRDKYPDRYDGSPRPRSRAGSFHLRGLLNSALDAVDAANVRMKIGARADAKIGRASQTTTRQ
jgi:hypothetical protein